LVNCPWIVFNIFSLRAYATNEEAVDFASRGNWDRAAELFDRAAEQDPSFAFYWLESGYAHGILAESGDQDALNTAIQAYEKGISLDPDYALNYANLGVLYWQSGQKEMAIDKMRKAAEIAPGLYVFWLNLGIFEEGFQHLTEAQDAYFKALNRNPAIANTTFWDQSPFRKTMLSDWYQAQSEGITTSPSQDSLSKARKAIEAENYDEAEALLLTKWQEDDQNIEVYNVLAELYAARDDSASAQQYLNIAQWVQLYTNEQKVLPLLRLAEVELSMGYEESAYTRFRQAYHAMTEQSIFGWASWNWNPYALFVYQRRTFPVDVLPGLTIFKLTPELAGRFEPLITLYESRGEIEQAASFQEQLSEYIP
jgi:tetratricopeptide (TPR) repeat protein